MDQIRVERPDDQAGDDHLQRLLLKEEPFFQSVIRNLKEAISPPKLPPLQVTSQPIPVKDIWGAYEGNRGKSLFTSVMIQIAVLAIAIYVGQIPAVQKLVKDHVSLVAPLSAYTPKQPPKQNSSGGGGGGGTKAPTPVSEGRLPKPAAKQFVPPMIAQVDHPKIAIDPTIIAPPDVVLPQSNSPEFGDPLSKYKISSGGMGSGAGLGSGKGGGVGSGSGGGYGAGAR